MRVHDDCLPVALFLSIIALTSSVYVSEARDERQKDSGSISEVLVEPGACKSAATAPMNASKIRGRHAAITNNFNNWRNYKEWTEKIRGTWKEEK